MASPGEVEVRSGVNTGFRVSTERDLSCKVTRNRLGAW